MIVSAKLRDCQLTVDDPDVVYEIAAVDGVITRAGGVPLTNEDEAILREFPNFKFVPDKADDAPPPPVPKVEDPVAEPEPELESQGDFDLLDPDDYDVLSGSIADLEEHIFAIRSIPKLKQLSLAETAGKGRYGARDALLDRISELEDE